MERGGFEVTNGTNGTKRRVLRLELEGGYGGGEVRDCGMEFLLTFKL